MPLPWAQAATVVLDSDGGGQVAIWAPGVDLVVTQQSITTTGNPTTVPTARVYRDIVTDASFVEGSYTGNNDASTSRIVLRAGEGLICVWSGGTAGGRATYRIAGVQYPPGMAPLEQ